MEVKMKILMIALVIGLLAVAGLVVVNALQNEEPVVTSVKAPSCGSCGGGCGATGGCSSPSCGANNGGSCGCGK
jgi:uncharacterized membrane protein